MVPDKYDRLALRVLAGLQAMVTGYITSHGGDAAPLWCKVVMATIVALTGFFAFSGQSAKAVKKVAPLLLVGLLAASTSACASFSLAGGYRAVLATKVVGDQAGKTLAAACKAKRLHCTQLPGPKECMRPCLEALRKWVKIIKPTLNTSQSIAWGALEQIRASRKTGDKPKDWLTVVKPSVCGLIAAILSWETKILESAKVKVILGPLRTVKGLVCS
jgi:hypothetical protein